jgi:hypothetical protein
MLNIWRRVLAGVQVGGGDLTGVCGEDGGDEGGFQVLGAAG